MPRLRGKVRPLWIQAISVNALHAPKPLPTRDYWKRIDSLKPTDYVDGDHNSQKGSESSVRAMLQEERRNGIGRDSDSIGNEGRWLGRIEVWLFWTSTRVWT